MRNYAPFVSEGNIKRHLNNPEAQGNWAELEKAKKGIDLLEYISKVAHPAALALLKKYGSECKTRPRPKEMHFNGRDENGDGMCTQNSILHAIDTGMELWSGYTLDWTQGRAYWHLWNVDHQGFVYDTTWGVDFAAMCSYFGVRLDAWEAFQGLQDNPEYLHHKIFLHWCHFPTLEKYLRIATGRKSLKEHLKGIKGREEEFFPFYTEELLKEMLFK